MRALDGPNVGCKRKCLEISEGEFLADHVANEINCRSGKCVVRITAADDAGKLIDVERRFLDARIVTLRVGSSDALGIDIDVGERGRDSPAIDPPRVIDA